MSFINPMSLQRILTQISEQAHQPEPETLKRLIDVLRVDEDVPDEADARIGQLIDALRENRAYAEALAAFILRLIIERRQIPLYTDAGIVSDQSFANSVTTLVGHKFLPLLPNDELVVELVNQLFDDKNDWRWLSSISQENWDALIDLLGVAPSDAELVATVKNNILNAIVILSYRISGMGLHSELMEFYPELLNHSAAFVAQNQEAILFVDQYRTQHRLDDLTDEMPENDIDPAPLLVMIEQCQDIVVSVRKRVYKTGISIRMTNLLLRLEQSLQRMSLLVELISDNHGERDKAIGDLTVQVVRTAKTRYSFASLIGTNTRLLSRKVTENASRVGENYISTDAAGYKKMFKKAAIGGLFIAFMATIKTLAYHLVLAPVGRAFVNSMIYGLGFVFIHIAKGTVATKQPAMTAAAIASTISETSGKKSQQMSKLAELIVDILRTQFVAILGNISVAMPVALIIAYAWSQLFGTPMIDATKAAHLLHELDPIRSLALPHAAIAGVFLFLSGLIAGFYDNLAAYNHIGERIRRHPLLAEWLPAHWQQKLGDFIEANLGAVMGNFIFGCFLGSTATVGFLLGLPLDIRHIAFAAANFAQGVFYLSPENLTWQVVTLSFVGVLLIGLVNLLVSFSLALMVAMRAKEVRFFEWKRLNSLVMAHFFSHPLDFILPRKESVKYAQINSDGEMIYKDDAVRKSFSGIAALRRLGLKKKTVEVMQKLPDETLAQMTWQPEEISENNVNPLPKPDKPPKLPK